MTLSKSLLLILVITLVVASSSNAQTRQRIPFNESWLFQKGDPEGAGDKLSYEKIKDWVRATGNEFVREGAKRVRPQTQIGGDVVYTGASYNDTGWRKLNLPHDWGIEGPFNQDFPGETGKLPWFGVGWYRKHFTVSSNEKNKELYLQIDGAMAYSTVWLNGEFIGGWPYGYASYELDLTPYIKVGADNVVAIRLDNPPDSSRWYPGGGLYRNLWLVKTDQVHVAHWGTYVTTPEVSPGVANVNIGITVANDSSDNVGVTVRTKLYELRNSGQRIVVPGAEDHTDIQIAAGGKGQVLFNRDVVRPRLWDLQSPNLYLAVTTIEKGGQLLDSYETKFGIRTIKFDEKQGFSLNGHHVYLKGVCNHHDLGALGSAINIRALERQLEILREMGVNAIRTSHNPPAPELLDLCDRMGFVVMDEAFDAWRRGKKKNDYHLVFDDWHEKDLRAQLRRDRNHPSIILWSIGNEIGEQGNAEGHALAASLTKIVHEEDPTRPSTAAANNRNAGYNGFQKSVDVFGYNYQFAEYGKFREANPLMALFGNETASTVSSRGEYFFPVDADKSKGRADFQVSSYDLYAPRWAVPPDTEFEAQDRYPYVGGEFVWTGFDYLGEPTPYGGDSTTRLEFTDPQVQQEMDKELKQLGKIKVPSRSSYFGIVDLCGFKKDRFYIYQARWRPDLPMAHILPHWNWPERVGLITPVHVYTSGDEAELFLNGRSLGRKKKGQYQYRLRWDEVKYEPGELRVVAYRNGKRWAQDVMKTTGNASQIVLSADRSRIRADGNDLSFVTLRLTDSAGLMVPRAQNLVRFSISGPGEIVAVDNGDAASHTSFQAKERWAYKGMALAIVRTKKGLPGQIRLSAESPGLRSAEVKLTSTR